MSIDRLVDRNIKGLSSSLATLKDIVRPSMARRCHAERNERRRIPKREVLLMGDVLTRFMVPNDLTNGGFLTLY